MDRSKEEIPLSTYRKTLESGNMSGMSLDQMERLVGDIHRESLKCYLKNEKMSHFYSLDDVHINIKAMLGMIGRFKDDFTNRKRWLRDSLLMLEGEDFEKPEPVIEAMGVKGFGRVITPDSEKVGKNSESSPKRSEELQAGMVCDKEFLAKRQKK